MDMTGAANWQKVNRKDAPMLGTYDLAATSSKSGFSSSTLILILIVVVAFYFLMIRPQQRRKQQAAQKQSSVAPGARVRTTAGMYATVVAVDGDDVVLEVAPGVEVRYMKRAIMDVVSPGDEPEETVTDFNDTESDDTDTDDTDDTHTDTDADTDTDVNPDAEWETFDHDDVAETGSTTTGSTTKD
jgi:preprotein translocase subunit YajC